MKKIETTLLLLRRDDEILLGLKKRGFGANKYNGVGGKLKENENVEEAMLRETKEEINVIPINYEKVGVMEFIEYNNNEKENVIFHLFISNKWEGEPSESEEIKPMWFKINDMPYDNMFPDDKYWLPHILNNEKIRCYFEFDENWSIIKKDIRPLKEGE